jgi:sulfite dehydrogenase
MNMKTLIAATLAAFALPAMALEITLPAETATWRPSDLPGYRLVQQNCMTCHSAQYAETQPQTSPRAYWDATVKKMKKPYGAPVRDEDMPAIVDYLVKTYGAERGSATPVAAAAVPAAPTAAGGAPRTADALLGANQCSACHAVDKKVVGPAFHDVAAKYAGNADATGKVMQSIRNGGSGKWGQVPMPGFPQLDEADLKTLATYVLSR